MIGACLLVWCLGQGFVGSERITFSHDVRDNSRTERIIAFELPWVVGGFVEQSAARDAVFGGVLPLKINALNGYLSVEGGAILASAVVPRGGTHANFMARAQLRLTRHVAIAYWHWSNANLGRRNPAVDALGITVRLHHR